MNDQVSGALDILMRIVLMDVLHAAIWVVIAVGCYKLFVEKK